MALLPEFECQSCGRVCPREPRRGRRLQSYCGRRECQRRRKGLWQRQQLLVSARYRADQKAAQELRREKRPGYWQEYRRLNPEAAEKNRVAQRERDRRRRDGARQKSVPRTTPQPLPKGDRGPFTAGRYRLETVVDKALESWDVVLLPVSEAVDMLATMDALDVSKRRV